MDRLDVDKAVLPAHIGVRPKEGSAMAVVPGQPAPYAPASAILSIIERHRAKGLPGSVDGEMLSRAGVSQSLIPRSLQALKALELIDENGMPTAYLEGLRLAPESEYEARLRDWLDAVYKDARGFVDPATDSETKVRDAFRLYQPIGQQSRMVSLFLNLYAASGAVAQTVSPKSIASTATVGRPKVTVTPAGNKSKSPKSKRDSDGTSERASPPTHNNLPPAISGLIAALPSPQVGWTAAKRDQYLATFRAVLDFSYPIISDAEFGEQEEVE